MSTQITLWDYRALAEQWARLTEGDPCPRCDGRLREGRQGPECEPCEQDLYYVPLGCRCGGTGIVGGDLCPVHVPDH